MALPTSSTTARRLPVITFSGLEADIDERIFQGGKAKFLCVVNIFDLYRREKEFILEEDRPKPRPSSVLGNRDASAGTTLTSPSIIIGLALLPMLQSILR
ncbi:hypothetical protein JTB14_031816 [Gonioctena quinquepunctata]|nr:hypothetical protein JTB14_031816 [Gonioctena quinquepunctata]